MKHNHFQSLYTNSFFKITAMQNSSKKVQKQSKQLFILFFKNYRALTSIHIKIKQGTKKKKLGETTKAKA